MQFGESARRAEACGEPFGSKATERVSQHSKDGRASAIVRGCRNGCKMLVRADIKLESARTARATGKAAASASSCSPQASGGYGIAKLTCDLVLRQQNCDRERSGACGHVGG